MRAPSPAAAALPPQPSRTSERASQRTELREMALLICQEGGTPPCAEPCPWCLNEARLEAGL